MQWLIRINPSRLTPSAPALLSATIHIGTFTQIAPPGSTVRCWVASRLFRVAAIDRITGTTLCQYLHSPHFLFSRYSQADLSDHPFDPVMPVSLYHGLDLAEE